MLSSPSLGYNYDPVRIIAIRIVWGIVALATLILYAFALPVEFRRLSEVGIAFYGISTPPDFDVQAFAIFRTVLEVLKLVLYIAASIVIYMRTRGDWVAQLVSLQMLLLASASSFAFYTLSLESIYWQVPVAVLTLFNWFVLTYTMLLFPDGNYVPSWSRRTVLPQAIIIVAVGYFVVWGVRGPEFPDVLIFWLIALVLLPAQLHRYRSASSPTQRQQTKWIVFGMTLTLVWGALGTLVDLIVYPQIASESTALMIYGTFSQIFLWWMPLMAFPVTVGLAVTRNRLWDIDLLINRSVLTGALTIGLGAIFLLIFTGTQALLRVLMGGGQSTIAVSAAALICFALFTPIYNWMRDFVDHKIYGFQYGIDELHRARLNPEVADAGALTGRTVGEYEISSVLGQGGMGEVYMGTSGESVAAIKTMRSRDADMDTDELLRRFEREARALRELNHPNIVNLYDYGTSDDLSYIAMEYIAGESLHEYLKLHFKIPFERAVTILEPLAAALDYAHNQGYIHRDIKPANIMLREGTHAPVLMDFGIVSISHTFSGITGGKALGTVEYMAPEQFTMHQPIDHRADIYALGGVTFRMLTGRMVFEGGTAHIMFAHLQQPPPDPRELVNVPPGAAEAIMRALAKKPEDRFSTAQDFIAALKS
ncbi:MAG: protein kinase [Chloroflexota bacterium]